MTREVQCRRAGVACRAGSVTVARPDQRQTPARVGVAPQQTSPGRFTVRKAGLGRRTSMMQQNLSPGTLWDVGRKLWKKITPARSYSLMNHRDQTQHHPGPPVVSWAAHATCRVPLRNIGRLEPRGARSPVRQKWNRSLRLLRSGCLPLALLALLAGCSSPAVRQQRLVARPNMTFSDSVAFTYNSPRLLSQLATGFAGSGAAQNSGCTSCR